MGTGGGEADDRFGEVGEMSGRSRRMLDLW